MKKSEAQKIGKEVRLGLGKDWKVRVWNNFGWHVNWNNGAICLNYTENATDSKHFWTMVGEPGRGTGHMDFYGYYNSKSWDTPEQAIFNACKNAQKIIKERWQPIIDSVNQIMLDETWQNRVISK